MWIITQSELLGGIDLIYELTLFIFFRQSFPSFPSTGSTMAMIILTLTHRKDFTQLFATLAPAKSAIIA